MPDDRRLRRHQLELAVFLLLVVPAIAIAQVASVSQQPFLMTTIATLVHDVALSALVVFFVWSDGEPFSSIGWTRRRVGREAALGASLYLPMLGLVVVLGMLLGELGLVARDAPPPALTPITPAQIVLACVLVIVVACAEETIFRGYLLLRLREVTRSTPAAVTVSSIVFASGHLYEGVRGAIVVGMMGVLFALLYLWRRSLVAPIVMHFLQDFLAIVLIPALGVHR